MLKILPALLLLVTLGSRGGECPLVAADQAAGPDNYLDQAMCLIESKNDTRAVTAIELAIQLGYRNHDFLKYNQQIKVLLPPARRNTLLAAVRDNHKRFLASGQVNREIDAMYHQDQRARYQRSWSFYEDEERIKRTITLHNQDLVTPPWDFYFASVVLMHSSDPGHIKLAEEFAGLALQGDETVDDARFIRCAAEDRYLVLMGKPQVWGTQSSWDGSQWSREPYDRQAKSANKKENCR